MVVTERSLVENEIEAEIREAGATIEGECDWAWSIECDTQGGVDLAHVLCVHNLEGEGCVCGRGVGEERVPDELATG